MGDGYFFFLAAAVGLVGGLGIGTGCERMRHPPTYTEQWESVYATCFRVSDGEAFDATRRDKCIAAADKVMQCAKELKP